MAKTTVKIDKTLHRRAAEAARKAGYSSVEEFIEHAIEKEVVRAEEGNGGADMIRKLKGLGYLS